MKKASDIISSKKKKDIPWKDLSYKQKEPYYIYITSLLYKNQLESEDEEFTEEEIKFKENFIENEDNFDFEKLNGFEKDFVENNARLFYEDKIGEKQIRPMNEMYMIPRAESAKKKKIIFIILFCLSVASVVICAILEQILFGALMFVAAYILFIPCRKYSDDISFYQSKIVYCPKCNSDNVNFVIEIETGIATDYICEDCKHEWKNEEDASEDV